MFHSDKELFQHILDEIGFLENETSLMSKDQFLSDAKSQRAFARSIEIIGEAVNYRLVWDVADKEIPELRRNIERIIQENREIFG